jgi:hypothetical protein
LMTPKAGMPSTSRRDCQPSASRSNSGARPRWRLKRLIPSRFVTKRAILPAATASAFARWSARRGDASGAGGMTDAPAFGRRDHGSRFHADLLRTRPCLSRR